LKTIGVPDGFSDDLLTLSVRISNRIPPGTIWNDIVRRIGQGLLLEGSANSTLLSLLLSLMPMTLIFFFVPFIRLIEISVVGNSPYIVVTAYQFIIIDSKPSHDLFLFCLKGNQLEGEDLFIEVKASNGEEELIVVSDGAGEDLLITLQKLAELLDGGGILLQSHIIQVGLNLEAVLLTKEEVMDSSEF